MQVTPANTTETMSAPEVPKYDPAMATVPPPPSVDDAGMMDDITGGDVYAKEIELPLLGPVVPHEDDITVTYPDPAAGANAVVHERDDGETNVGLRHACPAMIIATRSDWLVAINEPDTVTVIPPASVDVVGEMDVMAHPATIPDAEYSKQDGHSEMKNEIQTYTSVLTN
jgi:hypothetical protein